VHCGIPLVDSHLTLLAARTGGRGRGSRAKTARVRELLSDPNTLMGGALCVRAQALAFTAVLPGWEELGAWRALKASEHLRRLVVVAAADHGAAVMPVTCWGRVAGLALCIPFTRCRRHLCWQRLRGQWLPVSLKCWHSCSHCATHACYRPALEQATCRPLAMPARKYL
jgi:hypothetical protein